VSQKTRKTVPKVAGIGLLKKSNKIMCIFKRFTVIRPFWGSTKVVLARWS